MRIHDELNAQQGSRIGFDDSYRMPDAGALNVLTSMTKSLIKHLVIALSLCLFTGNAGAGAEEKEYVLDLDLNGSDCIWIRTIRDYRSLDSRNLLIYGAGKSAYFVRLAHPSMELKTSMQVGFSSRDNRLCPFGGDGLVFSGGFSNEAVTIRAISRISSDQAEDLLLRFGKKEPERQHVPAPQEVEGAEIEELD